MDLKEQYDKLLRFCYMKTKDRYLAEDITQETFIRFWESHSYEDTGKELAYLYTIARNLCIDSFRKKAFENIDDFPSLPAGEDTEPERRLSEIELEQALSQLPEEVREMIVLRYVNEIAVGDISKIFRMSRFAVHRRIKEGMALLKRFLEEGE